MSLKNYRKEVTVEVLNLQATPVMAFILHRAWVSEFQALPEMDANANAVAIQTLKFEYEGFSVDPPSQSRPRPSLADGRNQERVDSPLRSATPAPGERRRRRPGCALRAMSGWEEEYVERHQAEANTARLCNEILARCLVAARRGPGRGARRRVAALLVAERDRELVALRRLSLGPDGQRARRLPGVRRGERGRVLARRPAARLRAAAAPGQPSSSRSVGDVTLRLPTAGDQEELLDAGLETRGRAALLAARAAASSVSASAAEGFDVDFARGLPVGDASRARGGARGAMPDLDLEMAVECSHCGAADRCAVRRRESFFFELSGPRARAAARRAPPRARLPLVRARHPRARPGPATRRTCCCSRRTPTPRCSRNSAGRRA